MDIPIIYCKIYLQTYRHDMTYSVLKVPLNPNQPTNQTLKCILCIRQYRNNAKFNFNLIVITMQPRDVASCSDTAVAGLLRAERM